MSGWRAAGLTYIRYSQVAAQTLRNCAKSTKKPAADRAPQVFLKITKWENGKPIRPVD